MGPVLQSLRCNTQGLGLSRSIFSQMQQRCLSSLRSTARHEPYNYKEHSKPQQNQISIPDKESLKNSFLGDISESHNIIDKVIGTIPAKKVPELHKYSTAVFMISPKKLNDLARVIRRRPVDNAILQMQVSDKQAAKRIKSTLALARDHASFKGMDRDRLIVDRAWVTKGKVWKEINIQGRAHHGIMTHKSARMHVVLKHGKSRAELKQDKIQNQVKKALRSGPEHNVKYNKPIVNMGLGRSNYAW